MARPRLTRNCRHIICGDGYAADFSEAVGGHDTNIDTFITSITVEQSQAIENYGEYNQPVQHRPQNLYAGAAADLVLARIDEETDPTLIVAFNDGRFYLFPASISMPESFPTEGAVTHAGEFQSSELPVAHWNGYRRIELSTGDTTSPAAPALPTIAAGDRAFVVVHSAGGGDSAKTLKLAVGASDSSTTPMTVGITELTGLPTGVPTLTASAALAADATVSVLIGANLVPEQ